MGTPRKGPHPRLEAPSGGVAGEFLEYLVDLTSRPWFLLLSKACGFRFASKKHTNLHTLWQKSFGVFLFASFDGSLVVDTPLAIGSCDCGFRWFRRSAKVTVSHLQIEKWFLVLVGFKNQPKNDDVENQQKQAKINTRTSTSNSSDLS